MRKRDIIIQSDDASLLGTPGINGRILHTPGRNDDSISIVIDIKGNCFLIM